MKAVDENRANIGEEEAQIIFKSLEQSLLTMLQVGAESDARIQAFDDLKNDLPAEVIYLHARVVLNNTFICKELSYILCVRCSRRWVTSRVS